MDGRIEAAQRGDREALASLVREHYALVFRFCARRLGDEAGADAAQETFVTMQRRLRHFGGRSSFETWLLGIAHNECRAKARSSRLDPLPLEAWVEVAAPTDRADDREALRQALAALSVDHREVVVLHELDGLRYAEIAEILGIPEGTVKSRLHHAFLNLRAALCGGAA
jgi:RNA polymerase sigma-70 factor, ECF subfamily